ncbi:MAG: RNA degradosome polyphosphate kinase, partial [Opitutaceae bacterium]
GAFYFGNHGGEPVILAGSADWMSRNFFRRIEVLFPIEAPELRRWIVDELFGTELRDTVNARDLYPHGGYLPAMCAPKAPSFCAHSYFMASANLRASHIA